MLCTISFGWDDVFRSVGFEKNPTRSRQLQVTKKMCWGKFMKMCDVFSTSVPSPRRTHHRLKNGKKDEAWG